MKVSIRWAIMAIPLGLLGSPHAIADPLDAATAPNEVSYTSPFDGYVKDEYLEPGGWAEANERVGEIGGWRTYLRQAQEPVKDAKPPSNQTKEMLHGGHGTK